MNTPKRQAKRELTVRAVYWMQSEQPLSHEPYATLITVSKVHQLGSDDYLILYGFLNGF